MKKIAVAMSGGVDSTVAVVLLQQQGYEVIGITLDMLGTGKVVPEAKRLADKLGIKHYAFDIHKDFKTKIIDYFTEGYKAGLTPTPCVLCNKFIKFGFLADKARELGCDKMATGHYVIKKDGDLYQSKDERKDQTYFLFAISQEQIDFCEFPLGEYEKSEIIKIAEKYGVRPKGGESQDICFVDKGKYAEFIEQESIPLENATIVDTEGNILKKHKSIIHYTIGQRKGLDIGGLTSPKYVIKIDAAKNQVVVGDREDLSTLKVNLVNINWLPTSNHSHLERESKSQSGFGVGIKKDILVKLRYAQPLRKAELYLYEGYIILEEPDFAVAPGQACVFYDENNRLLGGGFIK